ncbi:PIG-L deacetylase family protein [Nocardioides euryhalodurans]|nr:PIG-L family deacetylase [Nocardioides euryhalodurans]
MTADRTTDVTALGTVLGVWAHPDDETYLAGGLLAALRDAGNRVVCVTATRGEAADPSATAGERIALAALRTRELEAALSILGVAEHHWLDHPDGGCSALDPVRPARHLARLIEAVRVDTVLTFGPDGFTGHPDHRAVSAWTDLAVRLATGAGVVPRVLHAVASDHPVDPGLDADFGVFDLGQPRVCADEDVLVRLPLTGEALDRKVAALLAQESQTSALVAAVGADRFRAWVATEHWAAPEVG